jgi:hypothetical protein
MGKTTDAPGHHPGRVAGTKPTAKPLESRRRLALLLVMLVAVCAVLAHTFLVGGRRGRAEARAGAVVRQPAIAVSSRVIDDSGLDEKAYRRRHRWFFDREAEIIASAPEELKTTHRPVPELREVKGGIVKTRIRRVRWVPKEPAAPVETADSPTLPVQLD